MDDRRIVLVTALISLTTAVIDLIRLILTGTQKRPRSRRSSPKHKR